MSRNIASGGRKGSTLLTVMVIIAVVAGLVGAALNLTQGTARNTDATRAYEQALGIADGSLDLAFASWRHLAKSSTALAPSTSVFSAIPRPANSNFPDIASFTLSNYGVSAVDPLLKPLATNTTPPPAQNGRGSGTQNFCYLATADVSVPTVGRRVTARLRRVFQKRIQSPWNFAVFYNDALELHPNANLTLTGWVHTNDTLYTGSNKLTLADRMTSVGNWNVAFAPGDGPHVGQTATAPTFPADLPPAQEDLFQPFGLDPKNFTKADANTNNDSYRELIEQPNTGYSDPIASMRYYTQAGIKITIDANGTFTIRNQAGTVVGPSSKGEDFKIFQTLNQALSKNSIQDNREVGTAPLTTLDIGILNGGNINYNGIVYISDVSATGLNNKGIRLKNGASLPTAGLTVVSDNPVYVQGDWNTGAAPPSNSGDPTKPMNATYAHRPSAIIADSVTLLSNAWTDANSSASLSARVAANTTVNAALIAGDVPTGSVGSNYSGGAENFVRFLEDWTGKTFTYYGSMLQLYRSELAGGTWGKANVYQSPTLRWYFDTNFTTVSPPGNAVMISYVQQRWFQQ